MKTQLFLLALCVCYAYAGPFGFTFYDRTEQGNKIDKASSKMLKTAYTAATNKNVVMSPVAVLMLLNLYISNTETGKARDEILELSGETNLIEAYNTNRYLARGFSSSTSALNFKSKMYLSNDYTVTDQFELSADGLETDVENINFHDLKTAATKINQWAKKETKGHIKDAVSEDKLDPSIATALFNVIYFEGHWHVPFNASETVDKDFHVDKKTTVKKPMMKLEMPLMYGENKEMGARFLELPYKEDGFRMIITLPDEIDGLPKVLEKMSTTGVLNDVYNLSPGTSEVKLEMPRFKIESESDFKTILPKMGVKAIFSEAVPNIVKERSLVADKLFQKAFVKVDEEGATAGAFTGLIAVPTSSNYQPPPPREFKVDRPFAFTILHRDIVLFMGTYVH